MRHFNICYTGWFNYRYNTCGHLYQERYKAILVDADNYLLELSRYVHLNPVRAKEYAGFSCNEKLKFLLRYKWSSLLGYIDPKHIIDFVDYDPVLEEVSGRHAYQKFIYDGLENGVKNISEMIQFQVILGDDDFVAKIKAKYLNSGSLREQPAYREITAIVLSPEQVIKVCSEILKVTPDQIKARSGDGVIRGIVAYMLHKYCSITQHEIGEILGGIGYTAVNMLIRRFKEKIEYPDIKNMYTVVEARIKNL